MSEKENVVDNIILDGSTKIEQAGSTGIVLFSALKSDAKPILQYDISIEGVDYPKLFSAKCAICNSPHRELLEHVYIDCGKKVNPVIIFFEKHYGAKLNFAQVKQHVNYHCDFNKIEISGLKAYEGKGEEFAKWKYREYELALNVVLSEIDNIGGKSTRTLDDSFKKAAILEKLNKQLMMIKQQRDDSTLGLPNVFEVLHDVHEKLLHEDDRRIVRETANELRKIIS